MCKLMIMSGIKDETKDKAWEFIKLMSVQMSAPNSPENDGVGYAAIDSEGKLFGERWLNNKEAFKHQNTYGSGINDELMKKFKIISMEKVYNSFGTFNENIRSITLHSRASTNTKSLRNTHPFVEGSTSVVHNGVIYNDDKLIKKNSSCDSEVLLHEYIKLNVNNKMFKIKKMVNRLEGYYAMGIFSKTNDGIVILDIIKDSQAKLDAFFIKELDTMVFATPRYNGSAVEDVCKTLGFEILAKYEVKSNKMQRLNALTGEIIGFESFKPKEIVKITPSYDGYTHYDSRDAAFHKAFENACEMDKGYPKSDLDNVIEITHKQLTTSHSKDKHTEEVLERELEDIILSSKEYTEEEIQELSKKFLPKLINDLEKYNDSGDTEWYMDERFTWFKRSM